MPLDNPDESEKTFVRITQKDVFNEIKRLGDTLNEVHTQVKLTNGSIKLHRAWLGGLTIVSGSMFLYLLGLIIGIMKSPF